jgi:hypothetical protein
LASSAHRGQPSNLPSRILSRRRGIAVRPPIAAGRPISLLCRRRGLPPSAFAPSACCALHVARAADPDLRRRRFCAVRLLRPASSASVPPAAWDKGRGSGSAPSLLPPEICADRRRCGQGRRSAAPARNLRRLSPLRAGPRICAVAASAPVAAIAGRVAVTLVNCIRAAAAVQLGFRAQDLRQLVQVGLLSAVAPLVCLVSGLLFSLIFIEFNMATNAIVVNITLDGQNYPEWAFCVETALRGHGLLFHLTDAASFLLMIVAMLLISKHGSLMMVK